MTEPPQKIDDGGPAYPSLTYSPSHQRGMSVRMWLAGKSQIPWEILIRALERKFPNHENNFTFDEMFEYLAELRFMDADAMIAASRKDTHQQ